MDEFAFIRERLAPLAAGLEGARGLRDDASTFAPPAGEELIVTADALSAGVHFREDDPLDDVAFKALAVNISDLVAKGATPRAYLLTAAWPAGTEEADRDLFVHGLAEAQRAFGVGLLGGDTTGTKGPLTVSITALGTAAMGAFVPRSGARPGDRVYVTGTIGDAWLGLRHLEEGLADLTADQQAALVRRYRRPTPSVWAAAALRGRAHAAIDVSDGLIADAGHVAETSGAAIEIRPEAAPLSEAARAWVEASEDRLAAVVQLLTAGDDYEVLFCAPEGTGEAVGAEAGVQTTEIGVVSQGHGVRLLGPDGEAVRIESAGFTHF